MQTRQGTPAELLAGQFMPFMYSKHTAPRSELHGALANGIQCLINQETAKAKEKNISFQETLVALTIQVSNDKNAYAFLYHRLNAGYKGVIQEMINRATEFEAMFANTNWDTVDWYDAIDAYTEESLEEYGYDKEETYFL